MDRSVDGKNAYKPITIIRYQLGLVIFYLFHLNCKMSMFFRHHFIKNYPDYKTLKCFHNAYFSQTLKEILERKGICVGKKRSTYEN